MPKFEIFVAFAVAAILGSVIYTYNQLAPEENFDVEIISFELGSDTVYIDGSVKFVVGIRNNAENAPVAIEIESDYGPVRERPEFIAPPTPKFVTIEGGSTQDVELSISAIKAGSYKVRAIVHRWTGSREWTVDRLDPASEWKSLTVLG